jgi:hypothetical protein
MTTLARKLGDEDGKWKVEWSTKLEVFADDTSA